MIAGRFGRQSFWSVTALVAAGIVLAGLLLGSVRALFTTSYGWTLLSKLVLVTALPGLAAANKWRLVPALADTDAGQEADVGSAARRLRRSIRIGAGLFLAILLATAVLTTATRLTHAH